MKKILLLLISGLLVACLAGSSLASPFSETPWYQSTVESTSVVNDSALFWKATNDMITYKNTQPV